MTLQDFFLEQSYLASLIVCLLIYSFYEAVGRLRAPHGPRPPRVKYFLPWIGSAMEMGKDPDAFFRRARIKTLGLEMTYVTSPELISAIYRNSKSFEYLPIRLHVVEKVFGLPRDLTHSRFIVEELNTKLSRPWNTAGAFFGKAFNAENSYKPFKTFDDQFPLIVAEVPKFLYLNSPHEDSSIVMLRLEASARAAGWSDREIATAFGSEFWGLQANSIYAAYWVLALKLQQPEGLAALIAEVDKAKGDWETQHPDHSSYENQHQWVLDVTLPLLNSTIQESLRLASSSFSVRRVCMPTNFAGFNFEAGERLVCVTRSVHMDDEIHPNPQEFDPTRYMEGQNKFMKNGKIVPNHLIPFGGGISMCEGRHFALRELKIFLALMMTYVAVEIDSKSSARPKFLTTRIGTGIMHPAGDLGVKITKRKRS
ncbi:cytochrome P450 [Ramaria rubella]|nr:cytochrome P450 [Ramaria rubella]